MTDALIAEGQHNASIFDAAGWRFANVVSELGAKVPIARDVMAETGLNRFDAVGYDAVAALVNQLASVGASPIIVDGSFSLEPETDAGNDEFSSVSIGWARACDDAQASWGQRKDSDARLVRSGQASIKGSALGLFRHVDGPITGDELESGDEIVFVADSGAHEAGLDLMEKIATNTAWGYGSQAADDDTLGALVMRESQIYVSLVDALLAHGVPVHQLAYLSREGFSGLWSHGRAGLAYRIDEMPRSSVLLEFARGALGLGSNIAYGSFNAGVGFAICCRRGHAGDVCLLAKMLGFDAWTAGEVISDPTGAIELVESDLRLLPETQSSARWRI